jgi:hypothetical protein
MEKIAAIASLIIIAAVLRIQSTARKHWQTGSARCRENARETLTKKRKR